MLQLCHQNHIFTTKWQLTEMFKMHVNILKMTPRIQTSKQKHRFHLKQRKNPIFLSEWLIFNHFLYNQITKIKTPGTDKNMRKFNWST